MKKNIVPNSVQNDLQRYKFETHVKCPDCKTNEAMFTYLKCDRQIIQFNFNCVGCGNSFDFKKTYEEIMELYFKDKKSKFWKLFYMASYHDGCFQYAHDKAAYVELITRLNKAVSGWRGFLNRRLI